MRNIIVGILFIVGGLSGQLVLIGTNSSELLIVVGAGLLVVGFIQMAKGGDATEEPALKVKVGDQAVVRQEAVVYTDMDSRSAPVATLVPGTKVEVVGSSDKTDVQWLCVKVPEGQQGYVLAYKFQ